MSGAARVPNRLRPSDPSARRGRWCRAALVAVVEMAALCVVVLSLAAGLVGAGSVAGADTSSGVPPVLHSPIVGIAALPDGAGYWLVASDGGVFTVGDSGFHGSASGVHLHQPVVGIASTPSGNGYWLAGADGGVFTGGDAQFHGSAAKTRLGGHVVGIAATPDGGGYWLAGADGGVLTGGDAHFYGSAARLHLKAPIVGIAATPDGGGYWLVASDGGVFTFGDATPYGSAEPFHLKFSVVGMAATPDGKGYWLVASDGGVFCFGDAHFFGSLAGKTGPATVGLAPGPKGGGYWVANGRNPATYLGGSSGTWTYDPPPSGANTDPPSDAPEVPVALIIPGLGAVVLVSFALWRRRRTVRPPSS